MANREYLLTNRTYYIRHDGLDSNDGLTDTPSGAFKTWVRAVDEAYRLDFNGKSVKFQHGSDGSTDPFTLPLTILNLVGGGDLAFSGRSVPGETVFDTPGKDCLLLYRVGGTNVVLRDLTLRGGVNAHCKVDFDSRLFIGNGVVFGPSNFSHIFVHDSQAQAYLLGASYAIEGGADYSIFVNGGMVFLEACNVTIRNNPRFAGSWISAINGGKVQSVGTTFTGACRGQRFYSEGNSVINTRLWGPTGPTYFPGDVEGRVSDGGVYV